MTKLISAKFSHILILASLFWSAAYSSMTPFTIEPQNRVIATTSLPDFSSIADVKEKKDQFFSFLYPIIKHENDRILETRKQLLDLSVKASSQALLKKDTTLLHTLADQYLVPIDQPQIQLINALLYKINTVPPSIALAQAAIESAWGTSRFAKSGNNLFGQWCFKKGCGIVPLRRNKSDTHEVAKFSSVNSSVRSYIHNLNSFSAYQNFRALRQSQTKNNNEVLNSLSLIEGLTPYSEQASSYVKKVRTLIQSNNLRRFDEPNSISNNG